MGNNSEVKEGDEVYENYAERFKNTDYAVNYNKIYTLNSTTDLINGKKFVGWLVAEYEKKAIRGLLALCEGNSVIDVPCGSGKLLPLIIERDFSVIGLDSSKEMLMIASNNFNNLKFIRTDIRKLPLKDKSVDIVICNRFLHRIPNENHLNTLNEIYRVSKKYSIFYFGIKTILTNIVVILEKKIKIGDRGKIFYLSKQTIKDELNASGWDFITGKKVIPLISTGYVVIAKKRDY